MFLKTFVILFLFVTCLFAQPFVVKDSIVGVTIKNQFEKDYVIDTKTKRLIISFEKNISEDLNNFLGSKKPDFFAAKSNSVYR